MSKKPSFFELYETHSDTHYSASSSLVTSTVIEDNDMYFLIKKNVKWKLFFPYIFQSPSNPIWKQLLSPIFGFLPEVIYANIITCVFIYVYL